MKFIAKRVKLNDQTRGESGLCDVHYEVIIEAREWGIKSISVIVTKIEGEVEWDEEDGIEAGSVKLTLTEDIEIENEIVQDGEALIIDEVDYHGTLGTTVYIQRSL